MSLLEELLTPGNVQASLPEIQSAAPGTLAFADRIVDLLIEKKWSVPADASFETFRTRLESALSLNGQLNDIKELLRTVAARLLAEIHGIGFERYTDDRRETAQGVWKLLSRGVYDKKHDFLPDFKGSDALTAYSKIQEKIDAEQVIWFPLVDKNSPTKVQPLVKLVVSRLRVEPSEEGPLKLAPWCMYRPELDMVQDDKTNPPPPFQQYSTFFNNLAKDETIWDPDTTILLDFRMDERTESCGFGGPSFGMALALALLAIHEKKLLSTIVATGQIDCLQGQKRLTVVGGIHAKALAWDDFDRMLGMFAGRRALFLIPALNIKDVPPDLREELIGLPITDAWKDQLDFLRKESRLFDPFQYYRSVLPDATETGFPEDSTEAVIQTLDFNDPSPIGTAEQGNSNFYVAFDTYAKRYKASHKAKDARYSRAPFVWYLNKAQPDEQPFVSLSDEVIGETKKVLNKDDLQVEAERLSLALRFYPDLLRMFVHTPCSTEAPLFEVQKTWLQHFLSKDNKGLRFLATDLYHAEFLRELCGQERWYAFQAVVEAE